MIAEELKDLSDDQAMELLGAVLDDMAGRHPAVRDFAQTLIFGKEKELKLRTAALRNAAAKVRRRYLLQLRDDIYEDVLQATESGELKVLGTNQEIDAIRRFDEEARKKIAAGVLKCGTSRFSLSIDNGMAAFWDGNTTVRVPQPLSDFAVADMRHKIGQCLGMADSGPDPLSSPPPSYVGRLLKGCDAILPFRMLHSSAGLPLRNLKVLAQRCYDGAPIWLNCSNLPWELGKGYYAIRLDATDLPFAGLLHLRFCATNALDTCFDIPVEAP